MKSFLQFVVSGNTTEQIKHLFKETGYHAFMETCCSPNPRSYYWAYVCLVIQGMWLMVLERTVCKWRGHDLEDQGYAGPDSGAMDMYCHRCGGRWHHVLY